MMPKTVLYSCSQVYNVSRSTCYVSFALKTKTKTKPYKLSIVFFFVNKSFGVSFELETLKFL